MTPLYTVDPIPHLPECWRIDISRANPKWLFAALNTMRDAIRYWELRDGGKCLYVEWRYYNEHIVSRLNAALLAALDAEIQLHGVA